MRFFNTAGPIKPELHYNIDPLRRFDMDDIQNLIDQQKYFILHAPRQVGKTSFLLALMEHLNRQGLYRALYVNVEVAQAARENVSEAIQAILTTLATQARNYLKTDFIDNMWADVYKKSGVTAFGDVLSKWATHETLPIVLLIDEIDSLVGDTLISVLRQLRAGYTNRPKNFPASVILCGVRDVRDYRIHSSADKSVITGGSAFNIKAVSLRMGDFSQTEVMTLLDQHMQTTGQHFETGAYEAIWYLAEGQPWLTNALAYRVCFESEVGRDRSLPITTAMIYDAKEKLILDRVTHLDQLADKLTEERVRLVIEPILAGEDDPNLLPVDAVDYAVDLGLIKKEGQLRIANPIYREVIPRQLTYSTQLTITHETAWYVAVDGRLDMDKLLAAFQAFFREHSEHWVERFDYKEAGPQLLLQAFLQRIVNGGGRIEREYGLGRKRTDLLIIWPFDTAQGKPHSCSVQKVVLELKILRKSLDATIAEGLKQTAEYMDRCATAGGHLIVFDRDPGKPWSDKIFRKKRSYQKKAVVVWGM